MSSSGFVGDHSELERIVSAIVERVDPEAVILFGSEARHEATGASDLDLVVVMPEGTHRRETAKVIYRGLAAVRGRTRGVDIVVLTSGELERGRDDLGTITRAVHREGRLLYRRSPAVRV